MAMKDGIQAWVDSALDTKDELATKLINSDIDPLVALKVSTILTKGAVAEALERHLGKQNAAQLTEKLSKNQEDWLS